METLARALRKLKDKILEALDATLALPIYVLLLLLVASMWLADKLAEMLVPNEV
jgi:hypothetical protein